MQIAVVLGTRPEVIKLAPLVHAARKRGHEVTVVLTGQHREMSRELLKFFGIRPSFDLDVMVPGQSLAALSARILSKLEENQRRLNVDVICVQGDTTSAFIASYWGFCSKIRVAHIESGLRTYDLDAPFPEEANRQLIARIANYHFAPTRAAAQALKNEKLSSQKIFTVGNTGIDALKYVLKHSKKAPLSSEIRKFLGNHPLVLVTAHRRENLGKGIERICEAILTLAEKEPQLRFIYPVHPNPGVRKVVMSKLEDHPRIKLIEPSPYLEFVALMNRASVLLTDSGGVQEEGPTLGKPILVLRDETERPEGVKKGFAKLVGTDSHVIVRETLRALQKPWGGRGENPYGDGQSSDRIIRILEKQI